MFRTKKEFLYGFLFLIAAFCYSIYFILYSGLNLPENGILFKIYSVTLTFLIILIFFSSFKKLPIKERNNCILICFYVVSLFFITRLIYGRANEMYNTYFFSMGVRFIPALLCGVIMLKEKNALSYMEKALLPFVTIYTIVLASVIFNANANSNMVLTYNIEGGMNYQTMSYYSVFSFGLTLYLLANSSFNKVTHLLLIVMSFLQIVMALMTGSRGAFVLAIVIVAYYTFNHFSVKKVIAISSLVILISYIFFMNFENGYLLDKGISRIVDFWSNSSAIAQDSRWIRWNLAWNAFEESPIWGNGIGSVFYKVGFYSHNIFTDLLCEGGILLTSVFIYILFRFLVKIKRLISYDRKFELILIIFLCSFVNILFSGYYLSETGIWLSFVYILGYKIDCE